MKRLLLVVMCLVAVAVAGPASAATLGLDHLIGTLLSAEPSSSASELGYVNNLINWYNGTISDPSGGGYTYDLNAGASVVPAPLIAVATGPGVQSAGSPSFPIDTTGYTYLWAKFGQDGALYWLGGINPVDSFTPAYGPFDQEGGGLSHVTLFGPGTTTRVPEAGSLLLFGSGLIGLVGYRRMRRMQ